MEKRVILMVEDETDILQANREYLEKSGYSVNCASTIAEAWASLWEYPPSLILLDVKLPDGSGFEFCRDLRKTSTVPVIFLTSLDDEEDIISGLVEGGDDYIIKPYSMKVLGARVEAGLRRAGIGMGRMELPPMYIDVAAGQVQLDGDNIPLSRKEFQLLVYFAEHLGQEFSQHALYKAVWGGEPDTMGSTVRVAVSRLRQKLRLDDDSCFALQSTRHNGYMFLRLKYPQSGGE